MLSNAAVCETVAVVTDISHLLALCIAQHVLGAFQAPWAQEATTASTSGELLWKFQQMMHCHVAVQRSQ